MIDGKGRRMGRPRRTGIGSGYPQIAHSSILYRRTALEAVGGYRTDSDYFEDRDLYLRMAEQGQIVVIDRPLIQVRFAGQHARLNDDPEVVLRKLTRFYACDPAGGERLSPMSFYSIAHLAMFASKRPRIFGLMLRRSDFTRLEVAIPAAAMVGLTELSPWLARKVWQAATAVRGWFGPPVQPPEEVYVWNPTAPAAKIRTGAGPLPAKSSRSDSDALACQADA
jgi:hypothetical protein